MAKPTIRQAGTQHSVLVHGVNYWRTRGKSKARYAPQTLCGRLATGTSPNAFDSSDPNACGRCDASVRRTAREAV